MDTPVVRRVTEEAFDTQKTMKDEIAKFRAAYSRYEAIQKEVKIKAEGGSLTPRTKERSEAAIEVAWQSLMAADRRLNRKLKGAKLCEKTFTYFSLGCDRRALACGVSSDPVYQEKFLEEVGKAHEEFKKAVGES